MVSTRPLGKAPCGEGGCGGCGPQQTTGCAEPDVLDELLPWLSGCDDAAFPSYEQALLQDEPTRLGGGHWTLCRHEHRVAPGEPGESEEAKRQRTTCHHTHVRVVRRDAKAATAAEEATAPVDSAALSENDDDAPPERKRNRKAVRKYRARKKESEQRTAEQASTLGAQNAALRAENAALRARLAQIAVLTAFN